MNVLILVDIQNDFLPGGALAVPHGDAAVPVANGIQSAFDLVVVTQDWHPQNHGSFVSNHPGKKPFEQIDLDGLPQTLWPDHCVQGSRGAELAATLRRDRLEGVFQKGVDARIDSCSVFFDNGHRKSTGLGEWLKTRGASEVHVCGLARDYGVKFIALDAICLGLKTSLVEDACRGVHLRPNAVASAVNEMRRAGVSLMSSANFSQ